MNDKIHRRVTALERHKQTMSDDIHEIKQDVHDIKRDVAADKKVTDMNTREIKSTNKILSDTQLLHAEFNTMFKGTIETVTVVWGVTKTIGKVIGVLAGLGLTALGLYLKYGG